LSQQPSQQPTQIILQLAQSSLCNAQRETELAQALQTHYHADLQLQIKVTPLSPAQQAVLPVSLYQHAAQQRQQQCLQDLEAMPLYQALQQQFKVKVIDLKVKNED